MGLGIQTEAVVAYIFALVLLYLAGWLLLVPLKMLVKLLINGLLGGIALVVLNFFGAGFGVSIAVNPITALLAGFFGVPGIILILLLQIIIV